ncbi:MULTISPECIES: DUF4083 family protein [Pontibacillus]|uniref:DUF4083 family protein n=1 Tax=Pontibacillus chungwhensis TaxID=265426 RepID=A0ABY8V0D6_9BACI|nr:MULTISPECIES: DUF4083 family protein [Pontibacillus]MCD5322112.1 DUF4083 family protein [Pontibacillus sp. HN14]WIF99411.1 DUF4083 family protein [Pontibacillus chungwhensis]
MSGIGLLGVVWLLLIVGLIVLFLVSFTYFLRRTFQKNVGDRLERVEKKVDGLTEKFQKK